MKRAFCTYFALLLLALPAGCPSPDETPEGSAGYQPPEGRAQRLALVREGEALALVEIDLAKGTQRQVADPIEGWFQTRQGYVLGGPSAELWASRDHGRAVLFGQPHQGGPPQLHVLRDGAWEHWRDVEDLQAVYVAPGLELIVAVSAPTSELFSDSELRVFNYAGDELWSAPGTTGLSNVALGPDGNWVLVEDAGQAVIVDPQGEVARFRPELGAAGQSALGWAVSAAFLDRIVFHGYVASPGGGLAFPRVVHHLDGTRVEGEPPDFERLDDYYVATGDDVQAITASGFVPVGSRPADFDPLRDRVVASGPNSLVVNAGFLRLAWFDETGREQAEYQPESSTAHPATIQQTYFHAAAQGLVVVDQTRTFQNAISLDAVQRGDGEVRVERLADLPVGYFELQLGVQSGSPWVAWAAVDIDLPDDHRGAYNVVTQERSDLSTVSRIERWAHYGEQWPHHDQ